MEKPNVFEEAGQKIVIRPKTIGKAAFNYKSFADMKELINFVGSAPKFALSATGEPEFTYKKKQVKDKSIIVIDGTGSVTDILTYEEAAEIYEVAVDPSKDEKTAENAGTGKSSKK